ncbi:hypothetical protein KP509_10G061900 [Ceratopteris richardii]|uniref:GIL1/IRKI C-terminal domain-containing protein n=1 Tax=Ceratopteris richardii TaxID=49495 RepID=A0A8T2U2F6_CERRI|nr:hypothetical protein KP509_1Z178800 [Ceratopteris richardii]KAH6556442.1 hypothetical protein KP509_1Z178900 [Ceratopteris richardii]KAH7427825.1 hypothetical protein KP509_10G061900 [Ceratopteris richardii]
MWNVETAIRQCAEDMIALVQPACYLFREAPRLENVLCECMFRDFENARFTVEDTGSFKEHLTEKKGRIRYYMSVKAMDPYDLYSQDKSFYEFVDHKRWLLKKSLVRHLGLDSLFVQIPTSFLKLGHEVWCLHQVAFAFEPLNAKIIQVEKDSVFREDHMSEQDDICRQETSPARARRTVAFMTLPGFTLGNSIIKAKVYSMELMSMSRMAVG